jgi:hypothetical protein
MKHIRQHLAQMKVVLANFKNRCNDHKTCRQLPVNETVDTPVTTILLSADYLELKTDRMSNKLLLKL